MIYRALTIFNTLKQDILSQDILDIKGVKIPNFFQIDVSLQWEFCHQFIELYEDWILNPNGHFFYENDNIQISEDDIIFDCGANMGMFAAYAASKGAKVYCFEPSPSTQKLLQKTQKIYPNNIIIIPKAISCQSGIELFCETDNIGANHLASSVMQEQLQTINLLEVDTISISDFVKEQNIIPTYIKIDIEGSERNLLKGAKNFFENYNPKIVMAIYHNSYDANVFISYFSNLNYKYQIDKGNLFVWKDNEEKI